MPQTTILGFVRHCSNVRLRTRAITIASATRGAGVIGIPRCREPPSRVSGRHCSNVRLGTRAITVASETRVATVIGILRGREPPSRLTWWHCSNVRLGSRAIIVASATRFATVIGILRGQEPPSRVTGVTLQQRTSREACDHCSACNSDWNPERSGATISGYVAAL